MRRCIVWSVLPLAGTTTSPQRAVAGESIMIKDGIDNLAESGLIELRNLHEQDRNRTCDL